MSFVCWCQSCCSLSVAFLPWSKLWKKFLWEEICSTKVARNVNSVFRLAVHSTQMFSRFRVYHLLKVSNFHFQYISQTCASLKTWNMGILLTVVTRCRSAFVFLWAGPPNSWLCACSFELSMWPQILFSYSMSASRYKMWSNLMIFSMFC
jgi:hypothetical protein